jgi:hypothetical protein
VFEMRCCIGCQCAILQTMSRFEKKKIQRETSASCLLLGMDYRAYRRKQKVILEWSIAAGLDLQSLLSEFVIVNTAAEHDHLRARELCADLKSGEIALFDMGYMDFAHLKDLDQRGVAWVNLSWGPRSVADFYRCRWQIEVIFKQIKQTLQLADFLGNSANAVRWQVWTALLVYLLLRYLSYLSQWAPSFTGLLTILRATLWEKLDLLTLLACYGTAGGSFRHLARPDQAYYPGFL